MEAIASDTQTDSAWEQLAPLLDEAMAQLRDTDRDAIVLRYFQNKSLKEVGVALGMEERAAQKRVARSLEKLRSFFAKRGIALSVTLIAGAVSASSVQAAPVGLAMTITATAFKGSAIAIKPTEPLMSGEDTTWWRLLQRRQSQRDYESALKTLEEDHDYLHRAVAAMILTNFAHRDAAWLALMEGVRDENAVVNAVCMQALITLAYYVPRRVDWSSAAFSVRHVLNGTNLFALPHVIETLLKTEIESKLAGALLKDNGGRMLLAYLRAKHEKERVLAHRLLVQFRGSDLGFDENPWGTWIASLK